MNKIVGHSKNIKLLNSIVDGNAFHHSFLFWGPESVGKCTIAKTFANKLICENVEDAWDIYKHKDLDLYILKPEQIEKKKKLVIKNISVDNIREANYWLALAPEKQAKVLIVDDAHKMTVAAQNALLKTLEEPKEKRYIILVTNKSGKLLDTIQSRCLDVQFGNVDQEELKQISSSDEYLQDSYGKPGFLSKICKDDEFREIVDYAREQLQQLSQRKVHERLDLAKELSKKDDEYLNIFFQVWIYRIWTAAHKTKKFNLLKFADKVEDTLLKVQTVNVNKQLIFEDLLINIK